MKRVISENSYYELVNTKKNNKATSVLYITRKGFDKIKKYFINEIHHNKYYQGNRCSWTLRYCKHGYVENKISMYGVSGDFCFGDSPYYFSSRFCGNKRESIIVFNKFIKDYFTYYVDMEKL